MSNGFDPKTVKQFVSDIQRHQEELLSMRGEYMQKCKGVRELIKETKDRASDAGVPKKVLNAKLKKIDLENKIENLTEDFEDDETILFDQLELALDGEPTDVASAPVEDLAERRRSRKAASADELAR